MIHLALLRLFFIGALANEVDPGVVARLTRERVSAIAGAGELEPADAARAAAGTRWECRRPRTWAEHLELAW